jgi:hypothetical protein
MRPYATLVSRFPHLLAARLERTLDLLRQRAPAELAGVDLTLLASQQPTMLLATVGQTLAAWRLVCEVCERVPEWQAELAALLQPTERNEDLEMAAEQAAAARQSAALEAAAADAERAASAAEGAQHGGGRPRGSWYADVLYCGSSGGDAPAGAEQAAGAEQQRPVWMQQDKRSVAAEVAPGAFGSSRRTWPEEDRQRARALARLLDARRWQLHRLAFLAEQLPEQAGRRSLLDVVMARKADFEYRHPDFPGWLAARQEAEAAEAEASKEERAAKRKAQATALAAAEGEEGQAAEQGQAAKQGQAAEQGQDVEEALAEELLTAPLADHPQASARAAVSATR